MKRSIIASQSRNILVIMSVMVLLLTLFSITLYAEEAKKMNLTITDNGGWVLKWIQRVNVYPYSPEKGTEGSIESGVIASIEDPSDPLTFSLGAGNYLISIIVLEYGQDEREIVVGSVGLGKDKSINLLDAELPFEVFIPA